MSNFEPIPIPMKWALASPPSGTGKETVTITASENTTSSGRSQTLTVKTTSGLTKTVSCSQEVGTIKSNNGLLSCDYIYGEYIRGEIIGFDVTFNYAVASSITVTFKVHLDPSSTGLQGTDLSGSCTVASGSRTGSGNVSTGGRIGYQRGAISNISVSPSSDSTYTYSVLLLT